MIHFVRRFVITCIYINKYVYISYVVERIMISAAVAGALTGAAAGASPGAADPGALPDAVVATPGAAGSGALPDAAVATPAGALPDAAEVAALGHGGRPDAAGVAVTADAGTGALTEVAGVVALSGGVLADGPPSAEAAQVVSEAKHKELRQVPSDESHMSWDGLVDMSVQIPGGEPSEAEMASMLPDIGAPAAESAQKAAGEIHVVQEKQGEPTAKATMEAPLEPPLPSSANKGGQGESTAAATMEALLEPLVPSNESTAAATMEALLEPLAPSVATPTMAAPIADKGVKIKQEKPGKPAATPTMAAPIADKSVKIKREIPSSEQPGSKKAKVAANAGALGERFHTHTIIQNASKCVGHI